MGKKDEKNSQFANMKFSVVTLGCFKNTVDSELLIRTLSGNHRYTEDEEEAELIIVNTCSFIERAKQESIDTVLSFAGREVTLIVAGCLGQQYGRELLDEIPGVAGVLGVYAYRDILSVIEQLGSTRVVCVRERPDPGPVPLVRKRRLSPRHYAFVKISDGCNRRCSFCIIPSLKGKLRSRSIADILKEIDALARQGAREIILISQDTTSYGMDRDGRPMLVELVSKIVEIPGIQWIRLLYNYPGEIDDRLLSCITGQEKVCNYLDIPVQHIAEDILRAMKREVSGKRIRCSLARIRREHPDIRLRTTLLVGFPGETEGQFRELCTFVKEMEFDRLGVFAYSQEERTASFGMDGQIAREVKEERVRAIMELQAAISLRKNRAYLGKTVPVLVDEPIREGLWDGRTEYDAPEIDNGVLIEGKGDLKGEIIPVTITDATEYDLVGRFVQKRSDG